MVANGAPMVQRSAAEGAVRNEAANLATMAFLETNADVTIKPHTEFDADHVMEFSWAALKTD